LIFSGRTPGQDALDTNVLVEIGPMDSVTATNQPPV